MTPASAALLLAAIALVIAAYVVACDRIGGGPHDGPWIVLVVLLTAPWGVAAAPLSTAASAAPRERASAQDKGSCLPWLASRVATGLYKGNAAQRAHAPATAGPAGVPGGFGSRGAALSDAGPANGGSWHGPLAMIAGRHLGRGAGVQERG